jgi:hypothetical protein
VPQVTPCQHPAVTLPPSRKVAISPGGPAQPGPGHPGLLDFTPPGRSSPPLHAAYLPACLITACTVLGRQACLTGQAPSRVESSRKPLSASCSDGFPSVDPSFMFRNSSDHLHDSPDRPSPSRTRPSDCPDHSVHPGGALGQSHRVVRHQQHPSSASPPGPRLRSISTPSLHDSTPRGPDPAAVPVLLLSPSTPTSELPGRRPPFGHLRFYTSLPPSTKEEDVWGPPSIVNPHGHRHTSASPTPPVARPALLYSRSRPLRNQQYHSLRRQATDSRHTIGASSATPAAVRLTADTDRAALRSGYQRQRAAASCGTSSNQQQQEQVLSHRRKWWSTTAATTADVPTPTPTPPPTPPTPALSRRPRTRPLSPQFSNSLLPPHPPPPTPRACSNMPSTEFRHARSGSVNIPPQNGHANSAMSPAAPSARFDGPRSPPSTLHGRAKDGRPGNFTGPLQTPPRPSHANTAPSRHFPRALQVLPSGRLSGRQCLPFLSRHWQLGRDRLQILCQGESPPPARRPVA